MKKKIIILSAITVLIIGTVITYFLLIKDKNQTNDNITITFNVDGGEAVEKLVVKKNETVTLPTTVKSDFNFLGWYLDDQKIAGNAKFEKDVTLLAKWEKIPKTAKTMKVIFDTNGGNKINSITMECGKELVLPTNPQKEGYTFQKWTDKNGKTISKGDKLTCKNTTLYAKWEAEEKEGNTISYKCEDGYTLKDTKCVKEIAAIDGCDKQTEGKYNGKCYTIASYKEPTCKVYAGNSSAHGGNPILYDGKVIFDSGELYCVYQSMSYSGCTSNGGTIVNGSSCYKYVQSLTASSACSAYSGYEYVVGNALYDTSVGRTNTKSGCYSSVALHKVCESGYSLNGSKCTKTIDATKVEN